MFKVEGGVSTKHLVNIHNITITPNTDDIENPLSDDVPIQEELKNQDKNPLNVTDFAPKYQEEEIEKLLRLADDEKLGEEDDDTDVNDDDCDWCDNDDHETESRDHDTHYETHSKLTNPEHSGSEQTERVNNDPDEDHNINPCRVSNKAKIEKMGNFALDKSRPVPAPRNLFLRTMQDENNNNDNKKSFIETFNIPPLAFR